MIEETNQELEIDLMHLIRLLVRKWWLIVSVTAVFTVAAGLYAYGMLDDTYTAESSMIVQVTNSGDSDYTNLLTGQRLVDTYTEIAQSNRVLGELRTNLDITYTNSQLRDMITVASVNETLIVELKVETEDPQLSSDIANELVVIVQTLSATFDGLENVEVLEIPFFEINHRFKDLDETKFLSPANATKSFTGFSLPL
mgnify:CR=1 FL=1